MKITHSVQAAWVSLTNAEEEEIDALACEKTQKYRNLIFSEGFNFRIVGSWTFSKYLFLPIWQKFSKTRNN